MVMIRNAQKIMVGKPEGRKPLGRLKRRIILRRMWTGSIWLRIGPSGGLL
jgi:hypothetical protein